MDISGVQPWPRDDDGKLVLLGEVPVPREQHYAGSLSHSQQGRGGHGVTGGLPRVLHNPAGALSVR